MDLAAVMDAVAARLDTIDGLRCFAWPVDSLTPPAAVVSYPEVYEFDGTYGRGMDRIAALPVVIVVGKAVTRTARDQLAAYCKGSGPTSIKAVLEQGGYPTTVLHTLRVTGVEFDVVTIAAVDYLAATFTLDITGSGS